MAIATSTQRDALAIEYGQDITHAALFTADPGTSGTVVGEVTGGTYARQPITWSAPSDGVITGSVVFDVPAGVTVTHAAGCSAIVGDTLRDRVAVTPQAFATDGTYTLALTFAIS